MSYLLHNRVKSMLYLVGLGLGDIKDITVKGLEVVRKAKFVFLEAYTSILCSGGTEALVNVILLLLLNSTLLTDSSVLECAYQSSHTNLLTSFTVLI